MKQTKSRLSVVTVVLFIVVAPLAGLLILYHQLYWGISDQELVKEITDRYDGRVVSAKDLDVY